MTAFIGCALLNNPHKDEWFIQLVGPGSYTTAPVLASVMGRGYDETLAAAMAIAGVTEIPQPREKPERVVDVLRGERKRLRCEEQIDLLNKALTNWRMTLLS